MIQAKYKVIAQYIKTQLENNTWQAGFQIPSEISLAAQFSASRMTARKAIEKIVVEGLLERIPSVGTFVKAHKAQSSLLEIRNIADEIASRGNQHKMLVLSKLTLVPNNAVAFALSMPSSPTYKVVIIHLENDSPIQLEERYVNAELVKDFLKQDFTKITSHEYLSSVAPLTEADTTLEAIMPTDILKTNLQIPDNTPCIKLSRITQSNGKAISFVNLYYPADRYKLTSHIDVKNEV
jgi:GntR family transcriptional regulator, histidine utilization repressor